MQIDPKYLATRNTRDYYNTTNTPLGADATFTGEFVEMSFASGINVTWLTDQDGTLFIDFSSDGIDTIYTLTSAVQANVLGNRLAIVSHKFIRVRLVNGSVAQTTLDLSFIVGTFQQLGIPVNETISSSSPGILARVTDPVVDLALNRLDDGSIVNKFGYNLDIDADSGSEIITSFGGSFDPTTDIMTTAQTFTISYNSSLDGDGTTGARTLLFTYIDGNNEEQIGIHVLGNTGTDVTSFTGLGINRCLVFANGGLPYNADDITITATTDATTQAQIPALESVTQQILYFTPIGRSLLMGFWQTNIRRLLGGTNIRYTIRMYSWSRVTQTRYEVYRFDGSTDVTEEIPERPYMPLVFGGREVIWMELSTDTNNTVVNARFSGQLHKN